MQQNVVHGLRSVWHVVQQSCEIATCLIRLRKLHVLPTSNLSLCGGESIAQCLHAAALTKRSESMSFKADAPALSSNRLNFEIARQRRPTNSLASGVEWDSSSYSPLRCSNGGKLISLPTIGGVAVPRAAGCGSRLCPFRAALSALLSRISRK